jgi:3-oxoacyl-[acyl-carrier protein] reductase
MRSIRLQPVREVLWGYWTSRHSVWKEHSFMDRTAIVIGASRGIGRSIVMRLAEDGFAVVVSFTRHAHEATETAAEINESGGQAVAIQADITREDEIRRLFETSLREFGRIDVVVSNVGVMALSPIARGDVETFDEIVRTNLRGAFLVLAQAASHIADGGRIIVFSNGAVGTCPPSYGAYAASKAGVEVLAKVLANELRMRRVTVNVVALGLAAAEHFLQGTSGMPIAQPVDWDTARETNDIVHVVSFLAGPDGGWVSGQVIPVTEGPLDRAALMGLGVAPVTSSGPTAGHGPTQAHTH